MPIVQQGSVNPNALIVPDAYVQIVPPTVTQLNGVPTNIIGIVGSASWGPVNAPQPFSDLGQGSRVFGGLKARKYDMLTQAACAILTGGNNFLGVRVTDGTDTAATAQVLVSTPAGVSAGGTGYVVGERITLANGAVVQVATLTGSAVATFTKVSEANAQTAGTLAQASSTGAGTGFVAAAWTYTVGATLTSRYTGTGAVGDTLTLAAGSQAGTYRASIGRAGFVPEVFDNISGSGNTFWVNLVAAINNGQTGVRGPSELLVSTVGAATGAPVLGVYTLTGGADGASGVTPAMLLGSDGTTRTGLYALRNTLASIGLLADADDTTTWAAQAAFALSEGVYMQLTGPSGQSPSAAASAKAGVTGADTYAVKVLLGDWCYFNDVVNGQNQRLVSPQGFAAGRLANLAPHHSGLNKAIYGIVGTQKSVAGQVYSSADLTLLANAGIDVITTPAPGGAYYALRLGRNASSNPLIHGDNYTRMTNYVAETLNTGVGRIVGQLQSVQQRADARETVSALFEAMASGPDPMIGNPRGTQPFQVTLDETNNPPSQVALGAQRADVKVQFLSVVETFLVNVEGGQSVEINRVDTQQLAA